MEQDRKGKPAAAVGGIYAKAKQRVLNKLGRRTTLTKNPRVDFISKRVEEIKHKKSEVSRLATQTADNLTALHASSAALNRALLDAYRDELGDRRWDDATSGYVRVLHAEEKRLVADMERALLRAGQTLEKVLSSFGEHLADVAEKPLTFATPEEEAHLETVMATKEDYKEIRTLYSDAMIDADAQLASGGDPSPALQQKVDDAKKQYEDMSERLCDDALKYEHIYREELSQRVAAHFTAEQHLVRGAASALQPFYPYTRGLTLDWQEMRAARRAALAHKDVDDAATAARIDETLPRVGLGLGSIGRRGGASGSGSGGSDGGDGGGGSSRGGLVGAANAFDRLSRGGSGSGGNPFGDDNDDGDFGAASGDAARPASGSSSTSAAGGKSVVGKAGEEASKAAKSAGEAVRSASKGITDMLTSYAPAANRAKTAHTVAKKTGVADDGWANIKL